MPELPEVETVRRDLAARITGSTIREVEVRLPKIVSPKTFARELRGARVLSVRRRAKLLSIDVQAKSKALSILIHLKMTGQLVLRHKHDIYFGGHPILGVRSLPNKYTHVIFFFRGGDVLYFNDLRQFGYLKLVPTVEAEAILSAYGVEPLAPQFSLDYFEGLLAKRKGANIKAVLLNQQYIAGLGNIYVDESLFRARVRPTRRAGSLKPVERKALWKAIRQVIGLSVKHRGTSFNTYVDSDGRAGKFWRYLKVYGRGKEPCKVCGTDIVRIVVAGRGTHYCPSCQK